MPTGYFPTSRGTTLAELHAIEGQARRWGGRASTVEETAGRGVAATEWGGLANRQGKGV
ncbi:hypothetical protein N9L19_00060 [bacterium]|nr:hypothetical protein [bacterium]